MPVFPIAPIAGVVRRQNKIVALFRANGAISPDRATTAAALGVRDGQAFRILCRQAILREVGGGRLYLDEPGWEALEAFRRRIAFTILGIVLLVGIVAVLWALGR